MAESLPPVGKREGIAELLDTLVMGGIAGDQFQAMRQGNGRNHRVGQSDRLAGAFQVAPNAARKLGRGLAELHDVLGADMGEKGGDFLRPLDLLEALDHLHDGDDGNSEAAMCLPVRAGITRDRRIHPSKDF